MDKVNSKILTLSFAVSGLLLGVTIHLLIQASAAAFGVVARAADSDIFRHGLPVAAGIILYLALQFNSKVLTWGDEVVAEVRKVVWPSRKDTVAMTIAVLVMIFISCIIVFIFDAVSGLILNSLMR